MSREPSQMGAVIDHQAELQRQLDRLSREVLIMGVALLIISGVLFADAVRKAMNDVG